MTTKDLDTTEKMQGALIQHGHFSDRIYLMKIGEANAEKLAQALIDMAQKKSYSKIFSKLPKSKTQPFIENGFSLEAAVPKMYDGKEDAVFLGYYTEKQRQIEKDADKLQGIVDLALDKHSEGIKTEQLDEGVVLRKCEESDVHQMAEIYGKVFPTYPFAIDEPDYLIETMRSHVAYFAIEDNGKMVSLASAEMDIENKNAEMTDFATLPESRGEGLAQYLLATMEEYISQLGILTAYTIARAVSPGMNITFAKLGYQYGGRLINNTNIGGQIESMNVWYKPLQ